MLINVTCFEVLRGGYYKNARAEAPQTLRSSYAYA